MTTESQLLTNSLTCRGWGCWRNIRLNEAALRSNNEMIDFLEDFLISKLFGSEVNFSRVPKAALTSEVLVNSLDSISGISSEKYSSHASLT